MKKKVIVAGHICLDINPVFSGPKVNAIGDLLKPGKLVQVGAAAFNTGGAVANTGLAMKVLGANVSLMGKIGRDSFGDTVMGILRQYGAEDGMIVSEDASTSYTIVIAPPGIDRIFLHDPAANNTFCADDIDEKALADAALFHFGYPSVMQKLYENQGAGFIDMIRRVHEKGVAISLDLCAVDPGSEAGKQDWHAILKAVLPYVDLFVPSIEELCSMLDPERYASWLERAGDGDICEIIDLEKDIRPIAKMCMDYGAKVLLLKCGAPGMYLETAPADVLRTIPRLDLDADAWGSFSRFEKSFVPDRIVSGTGCGDTSIAAFLTSLLDGEDPSTCLQLAAATGASCITAIDSLSGLKPLPELKARIAAGWKKVGE